MLSHLASPCSPTGAEHSLAALATGLVGRGHTVTVVVPGRWSLGAPLRAAGVEVRTIPSRACWLTYWERRPWPVVAAKWLRFAWPQGATRRLVRELAAWGSDVVHVNCLPHLRGVAAARRAGVPRVWHLREILPPGPRRRWWARKLAVSGASLVAVSDAAARWVRDEGLDDRVSVVPNGIAVPEAPPDPVAARVALGLPTDVVLAGFVGQLAPHKGMELFVAAAAQAMRDAPGLHAVLAGGGPPDTRARLERVVADTGPASHFHLLPAQPSGLEAVAACDLVCVPTLTPDPLPRTVMEAMAAGRPVVGSASGGIPEMVEEGLTGLLVPPGDKEALTAAVLRLARDARSRTAMGSQARRRCQERFSLDRHLDRMEALLLACSATAKP